MPNVYPLTAAPRSDEAFYHPGDEKKDRWSDAKNGSTREWMNDHPLGVIAAFIAAAAGGAAASGGFGGGAGGGAGGGFGTSGPLAQTMGADSAMTGLGSGASVMGGGGTTGGLLGAGGMGGAQQSGWKQYAKQGQGLMGNNQQQQQQPSGLRIWTDPAQRYVPENEKRLQAQALEQALKEYQRRVP